MRLTATLLALLSCFSLARADDSPKPEKSREEMEALYKQHVDVILKDVRYVEASAPLPGGMATLNLPAGYRYLSPADAKKVVVDVWKNPPAAADDILGMVVPEGQELDQPDSWAIVVTYEETGFISDEKANETNYDDVLKSLKEGETEDNEARKKQGFQTLNLVGWAVPPHYDQQHRVLYWAKNLRSGDGDSSLNYDMRVLGRRGVLSLNAVASMDQVGEVEKATPQIVGMAKFNEGHRYLDFNPKTDKVSKLGLAGLVLGGAAVAAKTGLFKGLWVALIGAKKFVIMGAVAVAGFFKRLFGKKDSQA